MGDAEGFEAGRLVGAAVMARAAERAGLSAGQVTDAAASAPLMDVDLGPLADADLRRIEEAFADALSLTRDGLAEARDDGSDAVTFGRAPPGLVADALRHARRDLLASEGLSAEAKGFIREHCPCDP